MNAAIKKFEKLVIAAHLACKVVVDPPAQPSGYWFIDIKCGKRQITVEFRREAGFGIHREQAVYGETPAEIYRTPKLAARRVIQLIQPARKVTDNLTLKDLRELYSCSQVQLAEKVGVKQSAISRFEQRDEVKLGTLAAAIKALGGELQIRAHFPDADVPLSIKE
jgi:DNA-binding XRE family transcriptional regulator